MKSTVSIINMYVVCQHEPRSATKQINNNKQQLCDLLYVTMTLLSLLRLAVPAPRRQPRGCLTLIFTILREQRMCFLHCPLASQRTSLRGRISMFVLFVADLGSC